MKNKRREFIKLTGMTGLGIAGSGMISGFAATLNNHYKSNTHYQANMKTSLKTGSISCFILMTAINPIQAQ